MLSCMCLMRIFYALSCYILAIAGMTDIAIGAVFPETLSKYD